MIDILLNSKKKRDDLIKYLEKNHIETRMFYPPIHRLQPYRKKDPKFHLILFNKLLSSGLAWRA